jgi:DNA ligase D-like protein (predicted 3'-phosphoesterase)
MASTVPARRARVDGVPAPSAGYDDDVAQFVVQQHAASTLHYDFRLEIGGVLVSCAVPKGPSTDPSEKRLAMRVEDHSIGWGSFEGVIGSGYGAGAVIVWDRGEVEFKDDPDAALAAGHLSFTLHGEKLRGGWVLRRLDRPPGEAWLLIKKRDEHAGEQLRPESVESGRTIDEL